MSLERHPRVGGDPEILLVTGSKSEFVPCFEGFLETIDILSDPEMMKQLQGSAKDLKGGRLIDLDKVF